MQDYTKRKKAKPRRLPPPDALISAGSIDARHLRHLSVEEIKRQAAEAEYMARSAGLKVRADQ